MNGRTVCTCGMPEVITTDSGTPGIMAYTRLWHIHHQRRHLAAFPDCDVTTRRNLDAAIVNAKDGV